MTLKLKGHKGESRMIACARIDTHRLNEGVEVNCFDASDERVAREIVRDREGDPSGFEMPLLWKIGFVMENGKTVDAIRQTYRQPVAETA